MNRRNAEHWLARLFLRTVSLRVTKLLIRTPVTANQLTGLMILVGLLAAIPLGMSGPWTAILGAVAIWLYFLLDLCDGEVARWRAQTSVTGVYLDRVGHYLVEAAVLIAYGFRAGGQEWGIWSTVGVFGGLMVVLVKAETDLVDVARVRSGQPKAEDAAAIPRNPAVAQARKVAQIFKIHQLTGALETSLLLLGVIVVDQLTDSLMGSQLFLAGLVTIATVMVILHLISILISNRLRS